MESNIYTDEYLNFQKYWLVLKRRWLSVTVTLMGVFGLFLYLALAEERIYQAEAQLLIETDKSAKLTGLENEIGKVEVIAKDSDPLATEAAILTSRPIIEKTIKELDLKNEGGKLLKYQAVAGQLEVKPRTGTDVLEIVYEDSDPKLAAAVANKVIEIYIEDDTVTNRAEASSARQFITEQLPQVEKNLSTAEADLRLFKNQHQIADLTEETSAQIQTIKSLEGEISRVESELDDVNARYQKLQSTLGMSQDEASAVSALSESVAVQKVLTELQEVKVEITNEYNLFQENTPQMVSLREQEAELQALLATQIQKTLGSQSQIAISDINVLSLGNLKQEQIAELASLGLQQEGLTKKLASLQNNLVTYKQKLEELPSLEKKQKELERKIEAANSTYQTLLSKLQETRVAENQNVGNVRIIADAVVPESPVHPKTKLFVAAGMVGGALLGVAVAFLLDLRDNKIKNSQEAEAIFGYPLHGVIPDFNTIKKHHNSSRLLVSNMAKSKQAQPFQGGLTSTLAPEGEAFAMLQANLKLRKTTKQAHQVIAVTSTVPREGKSYVCANLATTKAKVSRILLVDGDMRRPTQHHLWHIANEIGLSNVLRGEVSWQQAIQNVLSGLDVLTAGTIPANAISLIDSEEMKSLITSLVESYDYIIFDTPPLTGMADTRILGTLVDGLLLVVRPRVADYASVMTAQKFLANSELNVLGIVVNGVDLNQEPYGYSYGYS